MRRTVAVTTFLLIAGVLVPVSARLSAESPVSGVYRANGQDARLAHAVAVSHEGFNGQPAVTVVLTEKDTKGDKSAHIKASFGEYGSALVVSIMKDGAVFGCEVGHAALEHRGASSLGRLETEDFRWADGEVSGRLTTKGEVSLFDETWQVDLTFRAASP
jgi:hypothetical protein